MLNSIVKFLVQIEVTILNLELSVYLYKGAGFQHTDVLHLGGFSWKGAGARKGLGRGGGPSVISYKFKQLNMKVKIRFAENNLETR